MSSSAAQPTGVLVDMDVGELADEPDALYTWLDVACVACGGHAGDLGSMSRSVRLARAAGAEVAAHPSYPDRLGFGRSPMDIPAEDLATSIAAQCRALIEAAGAPVTWVKCHGALYHAAARHQATAEAVWRGATSGLGVREITWIGPPFGALFELATANENPYVREGFADRAYLPNGTLVPRREPGALIVSPEAAAAQAVRLATSGAFEALCVHGDTGGALSIVSEVRRALDRAGKLARSARSRLP